MNSCEVVTLGLLTALSLCESLSSSDLNILGNLISAVGSIVSTCAAQKQTAEEACGNTPSPLSMEARVQKLEKDLDALLAVRSDAVRSGGLEFTGTKQEKFRPLRRNR